MCGFSKTAEWGSEPEPATPGAIFHGLLSKRGEGEKEAAVEECLWSENRFWISEACRAS